MSSEILAYGQFAQDYFVNRLLDIDDGFFVDIGCGVSTLDVYEVGIAAMSNTFILEQRRNWKGIAIDYDAVYCHEASKVRKSVVCSDLMLDNINDILEANNCPTECDYLSLDVDQAQRKVLDELDFAKYKFKIITYEHNFSTEGDPNFKGMYDGDREYSRNKFKELGYHILFGNVGLKTEERIEDWYVDDELYSKYKYLQRDETNIRDIIIQLEVELNK